MLETVQARLDQHPEKMTIRRQTAEHPFGTIKCWMGATHFLTKRLPKVATEMALNVASPTSSFLPSAVAPMITSRHCASSSSRAWT